MRKRLALTLAPFFCLAALAAPNPAGPTTDPFPSTQPAADLGKVSRHTIKVGTQDIDYDARPGYLILRDPAGKPTARIFHTTYTRPGLPAAERPVTFVFNGGPGSSSVWLHLGCAGPTKVAIGDNGIPLPPPGDIAPNPDTWLTDTDLVFIDPVGTGLSRAADGVDVAQFHSVSGDVASVGEFIRLWLTTNKRWASPKYLAGESYGTTRAAALSIHLLERQGIALNGIVLVSAVLDFTTLRPEANNDLPYSLFFPSYTASAFRHKKLPADLMADKAKALTEAETFATSVLPALLAKGNAADPAMLAAAAKTYARLTGLTEADVLRNDLKVHPARFMKLLLQDERKVLGRYDAGLTGPNADPGGDTPNFDPSYSPYQWAYTSAINRVLNQVLDYSFEQKYEVLAGVNWNWGEAGFGGRGYTDVASSLADALVKQPTLRVLVLSGTEDLATPYFATQYTINRLNIPPESRGNITHVRMDGGHMMYHYPKSHEQVGNAVRDFVHPPAAK